jgi:hypothetical protein
MKIEKKELFIRPTHLLSFDMTWTTWRMMHSTVLLLFHVYFLQQERVYQAIAN